MGNSSLKKRVDRASKTGTLTFSEEKRQTNIQNKTKTKTKYEKQKTKNKKQKTNEISVKFRKRY